MNKYEIFENEKTRIKNSIAFTPPSILIQLDGRCNLRCKYCLGKVFEDGTKKPIHPQSIFNMEYELSKFDSITFGEMGEVFLNKNLNKYIKFIRKINPKCTFIIMSNASMPYSDEIVETIINDNIIMLISLDSMHQHINEITRPKSQVSIILDNIKKLIDKKQKNKSSTSKVFINTVIHRHNIDDLFNFTKYLINLGCDKHSFLDLLRIKHQDDKKLIDELFLEEKDVKPYKEYFQEILKYSKEHNFKIDGRFKRKYIESNQIYKDTFKKQNFCYDPWIYSTLKHNSTIKICAIDSSKMMIPPGMLYPIKNKVGRFNKLIDDLNEDIDNDFYKELKNWIDNSTGQFFFLWNSDFMINLRKSFNNQSGIPETCKRCIKNGQHNSWIQCTP